MRTEDMVSGCWLLDAGCGSVQPPFADLACRAVVAQPRRRVSANGMLPTPLATPPIRSCPYGAKGVGSRPHRACWAPAWGGLSRWLTKPLIRRHKAVGRIRIKVQPRRNSGKGFSLLEFLMVVGVISILLGLLLPGLTAVSRLSRRVAARHETRMLAAAWVEYFNTYHHWPTNRIPADESIDAALAAILQGLPLPAADEWNPHRLSFVDFSRFDGDGQPVNPWGDPYFVRFDLDGEDTIPSPVPPHVEISRDVIVWTFTDREQPIGSWEE